MLSLPHLRLPCGIFPLQKPVLCHHALKYYLGSLVLRNTFPQLGNAWKPCPLTIEVRELLNLNVVLICSSSENEKHWDELLIMCAYPIHSSKCFLDDQSPLEQLNKWTKLSRVLISILTFKYPLIAECIYIWHLRTTHLGWGAVEHKISYRLSIMWKHLTFE